MFRAADVNRVPARAILFTVFLVAGVFLAGQLLFHLRNILMLGMLSGFVALLLNPAVVGLQRWRVPRRGFAVAIVTIAAFIVTLGLAVLFGYPLVNGVTHFANSLPAFIQNAENGRGFFGHLIRQYHVQNWVQRNSAKLASIAAGLGKPALALGKGALSALVTLLVVFAFVVLLLAEGPAMRHSILAILSPERGKRFTRIGSAVSRSVTGYMVGDMLTSIIAGCIVYVTLLLLGVPYALLWGLWVALVDFLPTIGGALAGIPMILFAFAYSIFAGVVTAVVFLAYTQIENHVLNPLVMSRTVKINPLLVFVSVLVGAEMGAWVGGLFGGFIAVLLAVPAAGSLQVIVQEYWRSSGEDQIADAEPEEGTP
jgi:predicted PurR-regulated permease PerM